MGEEIVKREQVPYGPGVCAVCDFRRRWCQSCIDQRDMGVGPLARERSAFRRAFMDREATRAGHGDEPQTIGQLLHDLNLGLGGARAPQTSEQMEKYLKFESDLAWEKEKLRMPEYMAKRGVPDTLIREIEHKEKLLAGTALLAAERWGALTDDAPRRMLLLLMGPSQICGKSLACAYTLSTRTRTYKTQFGGPQTDHMKSIGMSAEPWITWRQWDTGFLWVKAGTLGAIDKFSDEGRARQRTLENVTMLVLDEIGGGSWNEKENATRLDALIGRRVDQGLRTMMTTNLDAKSLRAAISERVVERINTHGHIVECDDFRKALLV